jgi:hypothetical protein
VGSAFGTWAVLGHLVSGCEVPDSHQVLLVPPTVTPMPVNATTPAAPQGRTAGVVTNQAYNASTSSPNSFITTLRLSFMLGVS